ncbi:cbb3-type cytochrome oxidase assembly protein CcoS [Thalassorhabdomicrobium marinisediminis]|uniref:Cbb3-type cytochrome oxidase assembly protein CcoS n=1 Tax=Thalassorhabdomicrobium marinisediminis TaxID=2170577 RepID=A0A2T7FV46_9RHOB|nr:cbb3-type cytochrome oxidase assembly protein CcoS [Thalassorhabdomicrobium marinisediminis]PVA06038.1 cbb3-type cytochrome oxidase assembly protein CcoS [Thalassorhabdomicrobium marinisediminis]
MSLLLLIPLSIGMGLIGLLAFLWALRHDQFDDPEGNAARVLMPEAEARPRAERDRRD